MRGDVTTGPAPRRLLSRRGRVVAAVVLVVAVVLGGALALRYEGTSNPGRLDVEIASALSGWPAWLRVVVDLGDPGPLVGLILVVALGAVIARRGVVLALVAPVLAVLISHSIAKPLVGRTIGEGLAYPSTHMTGVGAVLTVIMVLIAAQRSWPRGVRLAVLPVLLLIAATYAGTLSALAFHYPTDTIGGICLAVAVVLACAFVSDAVSTGVARVSMRAEGDRA
ncbi:hypothetical protein WCD74_01500 [Actinomycetospora sp. OC33-EN08]|uniref:Phosphatase PAP2 family protein n=1 Tax=Actinomycetospora aurantiaca TaxID=3129233 RepID=A0ABU8MGG5_9PSEU